MRAHGLLGGVRVTSADRSRNTLMFGKTRMIGRRLLGLPNDIAPGHGAAHPVQLIEQCDQQDIVGCLGHSAVERIVLIFVYPPA